MPPARSDAADTIPCPAAAEQVVDLYFMEHRAKLLDVAAFLDRVDRAEGAARAREDFRVRALLDAAHILADGRPQRARRMLDLMSDPTTEPIDRAPGKGAAGAYDG